MPKSTFTNLPQEKKDRIIDAAIDEFANNNYHKASITNIIEKANIASGSFYQYFENKEDVFRYLINIVGQRKLDYLDQEIMQRPDEINFFVLLKKLYQGGLEFAKDNPRLLSIGNNVVNNNCEVCNKIMEDLKPQSDEFFKRLIRLGIKRGDLKEDIDVEFTAKFLTNINYSLSDYFYTKEGLNENAMVPVEALIEIIKDGIKPKRGGD